jgi:hypothetical protein
VREFLTCFLVSSLLLPLSGRLVQSKRNSESDEQTIRTLEEQWLHARDAATLDRILASDFVHPVAQGVFLTKAQHIDWYVKHLPPLTRRTRFDHLQVRIYGDTAIANGIVIASNESGKEIDRSIFTDVFVYREGRWQAVNAQENKVTGDR